MFAGIFVGLVILFCVNLACRAMRHPPAPLFLEAVSAITLCAALYMVLSLIEFTGARRDWDFAAIGAIVGFWLCASGLPAPPLVPSSYGL